MKLRDWIRFKLHQCHHICYVCKYRERCWNELGLKKRKNVKLTTAEKRYIKNDTKLTRKLLSDLKPNSSKKCDGLFEDVLTIAIILLLGFFFIIYCVCQGYAM